MNKELAERCLLTGAGINKLIHPLWYRHGIRECKPSEKKLCKAQLAKAFPLIVEDIKRGLEKWIEPIEKQERLNILLRISRDEWDKFWKDMEGK